MKHLKKLSVVLMLTALFSVSFTSCIDNEVSPVVEAIYEAQADLIAAQAAVQNAEAALLLAQANAVEAQAASDAQVNEDLAAGQLAILLANAGLTNAQSAMILAQAEALADMTAAQVLQLIANAGLTDAQAALIIAQSNAIEDMTAAQVAQMLANAGYTDAQTAYMLAQIARYEAQTAQNALIAEQALLALVAQTNLDVAEAQNALELAQVQFEADMAAAVAAMEAAGAQLAVGYAWDYAAAMQHANNLMQDLLEAKADLASAQLMQNGDVSWEFFLAQLEGEVAVKIAAKADLEAAIADLEAYIANPTTPEAVISGLKAQSAEYQAAIDAKVIEMQVQWNKIMAIYDEAGVRDEFVLRYEDALAELNDAIAEKTDRENWILDAQGDITLWETQLADYDAALAAFQLAVSDAQTVVDAAQTAVDAAQTDYDAKVALNVTAQADVVTANNNLAALNASLALLDGSYQTAIANLATEQAAYDAGIDAANAALVTAQANLAAGQAAIVVAQADYNAKRAAFEAAPSGFVWTAGVDGVLGIHPDAVGPHNSYVAVTVVAGAANDTYSAVTTTLPTGTNVGALHASNTYAMFANDGVGLVQADGVTTYVLATNDFWNVGADDVAGGTNADRLDAAVIVLTAANAAIPPLQAAVDAAQLFVDTFGDALALALQTYNDQKALYDNQVALVAAAETAVDVAVAAQVVTQADEDAALIVLNDATIALGLANTALTSAQADLATFEATTELDIQGWIDAALADIDFWTAEIAAIQPIIDAKQAVVDAMKVEAESYIASEGVLSSLYADLHAEIIVEWQAYWVMDQELAVLENSLSLNNELIDAYGWWADDLDDLADYLADLKVDLANAVYDIEVAEQALAAAQVEEAADEAYIAYLEALVDTLEQRYANTLAIAAKYKALMDAALAS